VVHSARLPFVGWQWTVPEIWSSYRSSTPHHVLLLSLLSLSLSHTHTV
jgi:hypothetical protein